jgi:ribosomal protein L44E
MKAKTTKKIMLRSECKGKGCNVKKQVTIKRTKRFELEEKKKVLGGY